MTDAALTQPVPRPAPYVVPKADETQPTEIRSTRRGRALGMTILVTFPLACWLSVAAVLLK